MPSPGEWNDIEVNHWPSMLEELDSIFKYDVHPANSQAKAAARMSMWSWEIDLMNRLRDTRWTYAFLRHIHGKGIPDDEWIRDPGPGEWATTYFPNLTEEHHLRKATFDYFVEIYFFKLYSCLDTLGHVLTHMYDIQLKTKPDFHRAVEGLKSIRPDLHRMLQAIIDSDEFKELKELRHGATHNEALGGVNSFVNKVSRNHVTFGAGKYITSREMMTKVDASKIILERIFNAVLHQVEKDT